LSGLYHISADPISKYDLLNLIAEIYGKKIKINKEEGFFCDRSLDSTKFQKAVGFQNIEWSTLIGRMKNTIF